MTPITPTLLNDTYHLIAMAREAALARGDQSKAEQLAPVVDRLQQIAQQASMPAGAAPPAGILGQNDFQTLLQIASSPVESQVQPAAAAQEKSMLIASLASGGVPEVEIARRFNMTREEVQMAVARRQAAAAYQGDAR